MSDEESPVETIVRRNAPGTQAKVRKFHGVQLLVQDGALAVL
jgi:hypothetical protein